MGLQAARAGVARADLAVPPRADALEVSVRREHERRVRAEGEDGRDAVELEPALDGRREPLAPPPRQVEDDDARVERVEPGRVDAAVPERRHGGGVAAVEERAADGPLAGHGGDRGAVRAV